MTVADVEVWAAKRETRLKREMVLLGADPNRERSTMNGWARLCSEVRKEVAMAGGIRGQLLALYDAWEPHSGESSPLELVTRDALRDPMLTFRERLVLVALVDQVNDRIRYPRPWKHDGPLGAREVEEATESLGLDRSDAQAITATLITRGWLQKPTEKRKPLKPSMRFQVMDRDGFRCVYCGTSSDEETLHVDHVTPVSKGGTDDASNLATACETCNLGKSARLLKTPLRLVPR